MGELHFEWWVIFLFLAFLFIPLILSSIGIYYFISKKFSKVALIGAAMIFALHVTFAIAMSPTRPLELNLGLLGSPFSFVGAFFPPNKGSALFFALIGLVLNYFAVFSVVNFTHRIVNKIAKQCLKQRKTLP